MVGVALSGGVDSSLLLALLVKYLGNKNVIALIGDSPIRKRENIEMALKVCDVLAVRYYIIPLYEYLLQEFYVNDLNRCYVCKRHLYKRFLDFAKDIKLRNIYDGTNYDDLFLYRPGLRAIQELNVKMPLLFMKKKEIRNCAKNIELPNWNLPSDSCLATRIEAGIPITLKRLYKVYEAENIIKTILKRVDLEVRVKLMHNDVGVIKITSDFVKKIEKNFTYISIKLKRIGFKGVVYESL